MQHSYEKGMSGFERMLLLFHQQNASIPVRFGCCVVLIEHWISPLPSSWQTGGVTLNEVFPLRMTTTSTVLLCCCADMLLSAVAFLAL